MAVIIIIIIIYPVVCRQADWRMPNKSTIKLIQTVYLQNKPHKFQDSKLYSGSYQKISSVLLLLTM